MKNIHFAAVLLLLLSATACHTAGKSRGGTSGAATVTDQTGSAKVLTDSTGKVLKTPPPPPPVVDDGKHPF